MPLVLGRARRSGRGSTGGADHILSSLSVVQMDAAPVSTAAVAAPLALDALSAHGREELLAHERIALVEDSDECGQGLVFGKRDDIPFRRDQVLGLVNPVRNAGERAKSTTGASRGASSRMVRTWSVPGGSRCYIKNWVQIPLHSKRGSSRWAADHSPFSRPSWITP
jgi:hypothetical protein